MAEALRKADFDELHEARHDRRLGAVLRRAALPLGAPVALVDGVATLTTSSLGGGSHQITRQYLGEGAYSASSARRQQVVGVQSSPGRHGAGDARADARLGRPSFGAFTPGLDHDLHRVDVGQRDLHGGRRDADGRATPGHLMNGTFSLPEALQVGVQRSPAGRRRCRTTR